MNCNIGALVLAAGFSNRFGSIKLLAELETGLTVFEQTLLRICAAIDSVVVVTRPGMPDQITSDSFPIHVFDQAKRGMGASLAYGISKIEHWDACLICLADMPFIGQNTYQILADNLTSNKIIIPTYKNKPGNPVGFGREFFGELKTLAGDSGARSIAGQHTEATVKLEINDPAILWDVDTPVDLSRYQSRSP